VTGRATDRLAFGGAIAFSMVVLFVPSTGGVPIFPYADKLVHAGTFGLLAWTGRRVGLRPWPLLGALVAYAIGSEVVQATLLPERSGDATDVVADVAGAGAALLALTAARSRRHAAQ
jgi:hypothetical protein